MSASVTADWSIIEDPDVQSVAPRVAREIAERPGLEYDDVLQEAYIILVMKADVAREKLAGGGRAHLYQWLWGELGNALRTEVAHTLMNASHDPEGGIFLSGRGSVLDEEVRGLRDEDWEERSVEVLTR